MTRFLQTILWCSILTLLSGHERASALQAEQLYAPIKIVPGARTLKDMRATNQAWAERVLIEPMRQRAAGQPWQAAAVHFAQRTAFLLLPSNDIGDAPELREEATKVEAAGCRDPLILYLCLRLRPAPATFDPAYAEKYRNTLAAARELPGPKALLWLVQRDVCADTFIGNGSRDDTPLNEALELAKIVQRDGSFSAEEDQLFYRLYFGGKGIKMLQRAFSLLPLADEAPLGPWLQKMIRARLELQQSDVDWTVGNRTGDEKKLATREKRIALGRQLLREALALRRDRSDAAAQLITWDAAVAEDASRQWFDYATAVEFDAEEAYIRMFDRCLPRMGGSIAKLIAFGEACLATKRFETIVPRMFVWSLRAAAENCDDWREIYRRPDLVAKHTALNRALVDEPTRAMNRRENLEFLMVNAFLAGDLELAISTHRELPGPVSREAREKLAGFGIRDFDQQIAALESRAGQALARAETARGQGDHEEAATAMRAAAAASDPANRALLAAAAARTAFVAAFTGGDWVAPAMNDQSPDWQGDGWKPGSSWPRWHVVHSFPIGDSFELRAEIPKLAADRGKLVGAVFIAQRAKAEAPPYPSVHELVRVELKSAGAGRLVAQVTNGIGGELSKPVEIPEKAVNTVLLRRHEGLYRVEVNGTLLNEDFPSPRVITQEAQEIVFGYDQAPRALGKPGKMEVRRFKEEEKSEGKAGKSTV